MPVLAQDNKIAPRSVLRHRPIGGDSHPSGQRSVTTSATTPVVQRASRFRRSQEEIDGGVNEWQRVDQRGAPKGGPTNAIRGASIFSKVLPISARLLPRAHPLLYLGVGMLAMLALWTMLTVAVGWFTTTMDDVHYGRPRTFQVDAIVGHNDSAALPTHFLAINLHRHIEIIELPGGDASHTRIYTGPQLYGDGADLAPVTLSFADLNGDHKLDMIVHFQGSQIVFINDQGRFRPLRPDEQPQVEQVLQQLGQ